MQDREHVAQATCLLGTGICEILDTVVCEVESSSDIYTVCVLEESDVLKLNSTVPE